MSAKFVPLHVHSHYSLLKALPKIPDLVARAKEEGCEALALTDLGNLYGAIEFYKECKKQGVRPIIGLDANLGDGKRLLIYAENFKGYQNLLVLVTKSHLETPENPVITKQMLAEHSEGLLKLDPKSEEVALPEIFYLSPQERRAWETLRAIENGAQESGDIDNEDIDYSFPSGSQISGRYSQAQIEETLEIAKRCNLELELGKWIFPPLQLPKGMTADQELLRLAKEGLVYRKMEETKEVRERIAYEHKIIADKGFAPYFLVVADLLRFAKTEGILFTTRGSAGGSLISYLVGITTIDPLAYKLPFERFLNPERPKAPDIDMDFADNRRDEVIEYARKKYGNDHLAQIGTFGTMLARGVVRDVARALGYPYGLGDRIAKAIPFGSQGFPMTLERALKESPELEKMYETEAETKEIIDLGRTLEGNARHISVHAAGVVIAPGPLVNYSPLQLDPKSTDKESGKIITQYDMYSITDEYGGVGLLKFDFLGIRNLAILAHAVELVEATRGKKIDIENIPVDDTKTFEMLASGQTEGTFQLNGSGMTRYLKELRPTSIHDINAMVALFRPGPMESIPAYIERKHNPARIQYLDPRMKDILERSHGVITYQDDVLLIAVKIAGYSWLEADSLRKAMGKKIPAVMEAEKGKLIAGAIQNGMEKAKAEKLWKLIEPFAAYGFGKAHAASYGRLAYQTAYMKANWPVEYMAAILTAESGDIDTVATMVGECKRIGIPVLPPDVNESFGDFTVVLGASQERTEKAAALAGDSRVDAIRFGLNSIKNFGRGIAEAILAERKKGGKFVSISDFLRRLPAGRQGSDEPALNKKGLESLIKCGALDSLSSPAGGRGAMLESIELLLTYHRDSARERSHESLFVGLGGAVEDLRLPKAEPATLEQKLAWEKELLGLYVSGHPLERFREKLNKAKVSIKELREKPPGVTAVAAGMIEEIKMVLTRSGDQMAFLKLTDFGGSIEAVVFPKNFAEHRELLKQDSCIALKGRLSNRNGELSLVADQLKAL